MMKWVYLFAVVIQALYYTSWIDSSVMHNLYNFSNIVVMSLLGFNVSQQLYRANGGINLLLSLIVNIVSVVYMSWAVFVLTKAFSNSFKIGSADLIIAIGTATVTYCMVYFVVCKSKSKLMI